MSVRSTNFGGTWSAPSRVAPSLTGFHGGITPFGSGSIPQVGNDGTLYVAYETSVCKTADCNDANDQGESVTLADRIDFLPFVRVLYVPLI